MPALENEEFILIPSYMGERIEKLSVMDIPSEIIIWWLMTIVFLVVKTKQSQKFNTYTKKSWSDICKKISNLNRSYSQRNQTFKLYHIDCNGRKQNAKVSYLWCELDI